MRLAMEKDLETVRQAALLLEAENRKLVAKNLELQTELLKLKGLGVEQLALRLAELEQQLASRNKMLFGPSSEKRNKRSKDGQAQKPQKGHGPTEQPKLRAVEVPVELGDVATTCCPHCKGTVAEWVGQFEESEEIDIIRPAVQAPAHDGVSAEGPFPSDTVFLRARGGQFDAVLTMYHVRVRSR